MEIGIVIAIVVTGIIILRQINALPSLLVKRPMAVKAVDLSKSIFYHEDDYRQVEIVPFENLKKLMQQAQNIHDFSEKHLDGGGYSDTMIREENGYKLDQRKIDPKELDRIFSELSIQKYIEVSTGIRPGEMLSENTFGYGKNYNGIFFDYEGNSVTNIWMVGSPHMDNEKLIITLNHIGKKWNLLLMNWNTLRLIDLKDKKQIERYLSI